MKTSSFGSRTATRNVLIDALAIVLFALILGGCDDPASSSLESSDLVDQRYATQPPPALPSFTRTDFGIWRVDHPYQSQYGPAGAGYKGIGGFADDAMPDAQACWSDVHIAGYTTTWMAVRRDWLAANPVNWALVDSEISFGVRNNADFIYVDDPLSPYSYGGALITDATMLTFGEHVHLRGKKVAAGDNDNIQGLLTSHPHFFDSVDVFMPYGYNRNLAQLQTYFTWVTTHLPGKAIVPILGYHVYDVNPPYQILPDQLGSQSGDTGFIEMAQRYAAMNVDPRTRIVLYYYEPNSPWPAAFAATGGLKTYLDSLTSYLARNRYI